MEEVTIKEEVNEDEFPTIKTEILLDEELNIKDEKVFEENVFDESRIKTENDCTEEMEERVETSDCDDDDDDDDDAFILESSDDSDGFLFDSASVLNKKRKLDVLNKLALHESVSQKKLKLLHLKLDFLKQEIKMKEQLFALEMQVLEKQKEIEILRQKKKK